METKNLKIIVSAILTPDNTLLESRHRYDYKTYTDANGESYMIDGGMDYLRRSVNKEPAEVIRLTEEDHIEVIREYWSWGSYGPKGDQPLHYILLKDMEESHMNAIITNCNTMWANLFERELEYRSKIKATTRAEFIHTSPLKEGFYRNKESAKEEAIVVRDRAASGPKRPKITAREARGLNGDLQVYER